MKLKIKQILKRVFFKKTKEGSRSENEKKFLKVNSNSIIKDGTIFDFRTKNENRIYIEIGEKCLINSTFTFETTSGFIKIGNNVHLGNVHFICRSNITIEDNVTMAWGITIYDHNSHSIFWEKRKNDNEISFNDYLKDGDNNIANKNWDHVSCKPIYISSKVWVGFGVTILKGVTIGEGSVIGAMSVVTKDVPAWSVVAGNPAIIVKQNLNEK